MADSEDVWHFAAAQNESSSNIIGKLDLNNNNHSIYNKETSSLPHLNNTTLNGNLNFL